MASPLDCFRFLNAEFIDTSAIDLERLDKLFLDESGRIKLLPANTYLAVPPLELRVWCNLRGRYGLPTVELVVWLKERIGSRKAIEIGSGNGNLGHHLGIPMTDSYQQVDEKETADFIKMFGIKPTSPPKEVEKEDAENAVRRRKPQVVVASYVTEKYRPDNPSGHGNYKGVRYEYVIERCETFILIGNRQVHGKNRALALPHDELYFPWVVTRSKEQALNRIWIWEGEKSRKRLFTISI